MAPFLTFHITAMKIKNILFCILTVLLISCKTSEENFTTSKNKEYIIYYKDADTNAQKLMFNKIYFNYNFYIVNDKTGNGFSWGDSIHKKDLNIYLTNFMNDFDSASFKNSKIGKDGYSNNIRLYKYKKDSVMLLDNSLAGILFCGHEHEKSLNMYLMGILGNDTVFTYKTKEDFDLKIKQNIEFSKWKP